MTTRPTLLIFSGLPGVGKTTLARTAARGLRATYLRIDSIEQAIERALRETGRLTGDLGPAGYMAAYALAREALLLGQSVVADSVNPIELTRAAWREVAQDAAAPCVDVEVVCSDPAEHKRRVETRVPDIPGMIPPTWRQVCERRYEPWGRPRIVIETAGRTPEDCAAELRAKLGSA
ncbi:MAG: hypothetical protein AUJ49_04045 [Desulfovibrionaceae bacterium CG1_02_65_16]|nr:MAG: hypothetical protein AUJ49_04045 [Desulfovibrionaceae bacterium CG1_02_65_16]